MTHCHGEEHNSGAAALEINGGTIMRIANLDGRPVLVADQGYVDIDDASNGRFADFETIFANWTGFVAWARQNQSTPVDLPGALGPAVPRPRQVFGVGFNYAAHVQEAAAHIGESTQAHPLPLIFTKFPSSITGPHGAVELPNGTTDYEVEVVVVIGIRADRVSIDDAWSHVAGLAVGQDISSRGVQFLGPEQHAIGKSFRTFSPIGPYLVTPDEFANPADLPMRCWVNDELRQKASSAEMIYGVAELIALLSAVTALEPGDLIFTGTPAGVGGLESPPRYLAPGDVIVSEIDGLGRMENVCRTADAPPDLGRRWHAGT
jgi:2-keto-4-pentenoate hydratase/2-oxohepta-3-ene-1,7-dioic acid hydratase in catechol pathway